MNSEEIQAVLVAQIEFNRQLQQQTAENTQSIQAISRDVAQLVAIQQEAVQERQELRSDLDRLTNITERYVNASTNVIQRLDEGIAELKAGQEQQARVLDYLLQKEQNRQNGS